MVFAFFLLAASQIHVAGIGRLTRELETRIHLLFIYPYHLQLPHSAHYRLNHYPSYLAGR